MAEFPDPSPLAPVVTCRELAWLGIDPFASHDPDWQTWDDTCFCNEGMSPDDGYQPCSRPHVLRVGDQQIRICCRCWDDYEGNNADLGREFKAALAEHTDRTKEATKWASA